MQPSRLVLTVVLLGLTALPLLAADRPVPAEKSARKAKRSFPAAPGGAKLAAAAQAKAAPVIRTGRTVAETDPLAVARRADELIAAELTKANSEIAPRCSDEDFLRRVSFDIAGASPSPQNVALFGLDPDLNKTSQQIDRLLATSDYAENWAGY